EAGQNEGGPAGDEVRAVELGRDVDGQAAAGQGGGGAGAVGGGRVEVAAHGHEDRGAAGLHGGDGLGDAEAVGAGRGDAGGGGEGVEESGGGALVDAHRAVALDVGVAADRAEAGAGAADVAAEEEEVRDHLDVG